MNVQSVLTEVSRQLDVLEARLLVEHVLKVDHVWLITHAYDELSEKDYHNIQLLIKRRINGDPIAYILGEREFYGLPLKVTQDTLIPRPDTETLVEAALAKINAKTETVLDLGTGSGAVALAIAKNSPNVMVTAVDFSNSALDVAEENAETLAIDNVQFIKSDWFTEVEGQTFDLIVSNPPYIELQDPHLDQGDLRFEPGIALVSGKDGLDDIRRIVQDCLVFLKPQGWLMLEHGYNQAEAAQGLMAEAGLIEVATVNDLGGNQRVTFGKSALLVSAHWGS